MRMVVWLGAQFQKLPGVFKGDGVSVAFKELTRHRLLARTRRLTAMRWVLGMRIILPAAV